jgi:hypothetical protein
MKYVAEWTDACLAPSRSQGRRRWVNNGGSLEAQYGARAVSPRFRFRIFVDGKILDFAIGSRDFHFSQKNPSVIFFYNRRTRHTLGKCTNTHASVIQFLITSFVVGTRILWKICSACCWIHDAICSISRSLAVGTMESQNLAERCFSIRGRRRSMPSLNVMPKAEEKHAR